MKNLFVIILAIALSTLSASAQLTVSHDHINESCVGGDGKAWVNVQGGSAPYSYTWSPGPPQTTDTIRNLSSGSYSYTVTDNNGAVGNGTVVITDTIQYELAILPINCQTPPAQIILKAKHDYQNGPYTYTWFGDYTAGSPVNNVGTNGTANSAGTYSFSITNINTGCQQVTPVSIQPSTGLPVTITTNNLNGCNAICASGPSSPTTDPYSYLWSNGGTTQQICNLASGTYTLTVTDVNSCSGSNSVVISIPTPPSVSILVDDVSCTTQGSLRANATGGVAPYTYNWSTGETTQTILTFTPGTYSVTVTDANGCSVSQSATCNLSLTNYPFLNITPNNSSCNGTTCLRALATNGITYPYSMYSYAWSNGTTTSQTCGLADGTYTVTVTTLTGCTLTGSQTVVNTLFSVTATSSAATCGDNGSATTTAANGWTPYTYAWSNSATTATINNLAPGVYTVTVTDARLCTATTSVIVGNDNFSIDSINTLPSTCGSSQNGSATVYVSGVSSPFTYDWGAGATSNNTNSNIGPGNYTVTVIDANNCTSTAIATVGSSIFTIDSITSAPAACSAVNDGSATVYVTGANAPFTYNWGAGASSNNSLTNIAQGTYTVTITDVNGCSTTASTTVGISAYTIDSLTSIPASCPATIDGSATVHVTGNNTPFTYNWGAGTTSNNTISNIGIGNYTVTITDASGCSTTASTTVGSGSVTIDSIVPTSATCPTAYNGSALVYASGTNMPFQYDWGNGASSSSNATSLTSGAYSITVTNSAGCTAQQSTQIDTVGLQLSVSAVANAGCDNASGVAVVTHLNGTAPYLTAWDTYASPNLTASFMSAGVHHITVTDSNNCQASISVIIAPPTTCLTQLSGKVYVDKDADCSFSSGDVGLQGKMVIIEPGYYAYTDRFGDWSVYVDQLQTYNLKVSENNYNIPLTVSCGTDSLSVSVNDSVPILGLNFTYNPSIETDVSISFDCINSRAGTSTNVYIYVYNNGNNATSITGSFVLDPIFSTIGRIGGLNGFVIDSITGSPIAVHFRYNNLPPQEVRYLTFAITLPPIPNVTINQPLQLTANISPINQTDVLPFNNTYDCTSYVIAAYDPNDKQVRSKGVNVDGFATPTDTTLQYRIRFQNTGNDTAFNVTVVDTLDEFLNVPSFRLISTSHDVEVEFYDEHIVHFVFNNIMLPDSNVNEPLSHGFIEFEIDILDKTELDPVSNQAAIYFDTNPPIYTNMVTTERRIVGIKAIPQVPVNVYPNPTSGVLSVNIGGLPIEQVELYDLMGRNVISISYANMMQAELNASALSEGMYMVRIRSGATWYMDRVVIAK